MFRQRRNIFDSTLIRLTGIEENNNASVGASRKDSRIKGPALSDGEKKTSWRLRSAQFRAAIGAVRTESVDSNIQSVQVDPSLVKCPHCARSFNSDASQRHIPICQKIFASNAGWLGKGDGVLSHSRKPIGNARPLLRRISPLIGFK